MVMKQGALRGELVVTADEHDAIKKIVQPHPDGSIPPGYVTLIVTPEDRLYRYRDGITRILYEVPGGHETLCFAVVYTCPVGPHPGMLTTASRICFEGQEKEWWIILPGGRMMFITPDNPLRHGHDVVIVLEILDHRRPGEPSQFGYAGPVRDVTIHGAS
jgi:hypothetical protein